MVGIFCANVYGLIVSPFGGSDSRFGTNPWCFALPTKEGQVSTPRRSFTHLRAGTVWCECWRWQTPVVLDFATSMLAAGKLNHYVRSGQPLPPGVLIDENGREPNRIRSRMNSSDEFEQL